ncbi:MAG: 50S ribosomal protein L23 [Patescibacteria group bacterium]|nr:50S ribosomal protein L23 [Patescibacteria group bacterium]
MSIFGKNKIEENKKGEEKSAKVVSAKKAKPPFAKASADKPEAKKSMKDLYGGASKEKVTAPVAAKAEGKPEVVKSASTESNAYRVLLRPLVTEKASHMGVINKYIFEVDYNCNKIEVAKAIEATYGIKPLKVNMIKLAGKVMRRGRTEGRRKNWKKAIVTLPAGKTIQIYEGI